MPRSPCLAHKIKRLFTQAIFSFSISLEVCSPNFQLFNCTDKIRIVICYQYGFSALVPQTAFRGEIVRR